MGGALEELQFQGEEGSCGLGGLGKRPTGEQRKMRKWKRGGRCLLLFEACLLFLGRHLGKAWARRICVFWDSREY